MVKNAAIQRYIIKIAKTTAKPYQEKRYKNEGE